MTRIAETATLVVDNVQFLEQDVTRNAGGKTSAMEAVAQPNAKPELPVPVLELNLGFDIGL